MRYVFSNLPIMVASIGATSIGLSIVTRSGFIFPSVGLTALLVAGIVDDLAPMIQPKGVGNPP
jgi:hypothetical protein